MIIITDLIMIKITNLIIIISDIIMIIYIVIMINSDLLWEISIFI